MFEFVGCGERQLPAHHSDLVQNRLVNGATFQLESDLHSYNFLVCHAPGIPFKLLFAKNPFKKANQSSHAGLQLGCRLQVAGRHLATRAAPRRPEVHSSGIWLRCRCLSNAASARSTGLPVNSGCLHCPESGALASWSARTRLVVWQWGQTMCKDLLTRASLWLVGWNARLAGLPCLSRGQLQFIRFYFHSYLHQYSLAWRPKA